jgi:hypothetical protein
MQGWVRDERARVLVIFDGRDAAGKGSAIKRVTPRRTGPAVVVRVNAAGHNQSGRRLRHSCRCRQLERHGFDMIVEPMSFLVTRPTSPRRASWRELNSGASIWPTPSLLMDSPAGPRAVRPDGLRAVLDSGLIRVGALAHLDAVPAGAPIDVA